ncbi:hypothetical protein [Geomonas sp.]|uniref:hypothetical protein n=1 Tax=Geomonas sp. TaxID=2651584 RepID=UPI002B47F3A0|nr:hypothetical protein [Geomonas sp.]HJV33997.1 hypothetical protein [Geomonas sp.]
MSEPKLILIDKFPLPFLLSLPEPADRTTGGGDGTPVLCFLHGMMEGPPTELHTGLTAHGPLKRGNEAIAVSNFIVAAPQLPSRGDIWHNYADDVCELAGYLHAHYGGDPARTYLTGFSFGGNGVFDVALLVPDLWTALWPVDPTRVPHTDPGLPVWLSVGEAARFQADQFIDRLKLTPPGPQPLRRIYQDFGLNHVDTATAAYHSETVYRWLLSQHG